MRSLSSETITPEAFKSFGTLISAEGSAQDANAETARRFDRVAEIQNLRPASATLNVAVFRCAPQSASPFVVGMLEKHPGSTQAFIPMNPGRYLVIVAEALADQSAPDLSTLRAFLIEGARGVAYHPGTWHRPMIALDRPLDFTCLVYEDGSSSDCTEFRVPESNQVSVALIG